MTLSTLATLPLYNCCFLALIEFEKTKNDPSRGPWCVTANRWDGGDFVCGVKNGCRICQRLYEKLDEETKRCVREHKARECG